MKIDVVALPAEQSYSFTSVDELMAKAPELGWTYTGLEDQPHLVAYLRGLPKFKELCGPMGNGGSGEQIRYETWPANDFYSR